MAYIGSSPTKVVSRQSANIFTYTATANQTAFTGSDANGNTLACSPSDLMVHMNGIKLEESDYTATTTTVTLGSGAAAGDEVTITAFLTFESADHYTKSAADTRYVNASGDTMTGALAVNAALPKIQSSYNSSKHLEFGVGGSGGGFAMTTGHFMTVNHQPYADRATDNNLTERFRIDASGRVTMPYQPSFRAGKSASASGVGTILTFDQVYLNVGSCYSSSNGRFTAPVAGVYYFGWQGISGHQTTSNEQNFYLAKNGTAINDARGRGYTSSSIHLKTVIDLAVNDYVDIRIGNGNTSTYNSAFHNQFMGYLIG